MENRDNSQQELFRLKEILFGDEIKEMKKRITALRDELLVVVDNYTKTLEEELQLSKVSFEKKITSLREEMEIEKQKFIELIQQQNVKTEEQKEEIVLLAKKYDEKLQNLSLQIAKEQEIQKDEIKKAKQNLQIMIQNLEKTKINKTEIADLFGMMMQKLK